VTGAKS